MANIDFEKQIYELRIKGEFLALYLRFFLLIFLLFTIINVVVKDKFVMDVPTIFSIAAFVIEVFIAFSILYILKKRLYKNWMMYFTITVDVMMAGTIFWLYNFKHQYTYSSFSMVPWVFILLIIMSGFRASTTAPIVTSILSFLIYIPGILIQFIKGYYYKHFVGPGGATLFTMMDDDVMKALILIATGFIVSQLAKISNNRAINVIKLYNKSNQLISKYMANLNNLINEMKDESKILNEVYQSVIDVFKKIKEFSDKLNKNVGLQNDNIIKINEMVDSAFKKFTKIDSGASTQLTNIEHLTNSIEKIVSLSKNIDNKIINAKSDTDNLINESKANMGNIQTSLKTLGELISSSEKIAGITNTINDIAEKTNLLAMNASIEAAHAGASGKGFSVVANEIKKLAESTSSSSKQINSMIKNTISLLEQGKDTFTKVFKFLNIILERMNELQTMINSISIQTSSQMENANILKTTAEELLNFTKNIQQLMTEMTSLNKGIMSSVGHLSDFSKEILRIAEIESISANKLYDKLNKINELLISYEQRINTLDEVIKDLEKERKEQLISNSRDTAKITNGNMDK